jgi:hypothetical protein
MDIVVTLPTVSAVKGVLSEDKSNFSSQKCIAIRASLIRL